MLQSTDVLRTGVVIPSVSEKFTMDASLRSLRSAWQCICKTLSY